jgi:hypothetical protein
MKPGAERLNLFRGAREVERLFEKAMQELVEGCAVRPERQSAFPPSIALVLGRGLHFQLDGNVNDGQRDAVDERSNARPRDVDLVLSLLREVAANVVAAPSQRSSTGMNRRERQSHAGCACQDRSGAADDLGQSSNESNSLTGMVHVSPPVFERRSRYAGKRFGRGQLCGRPLKQRRGDQFPVKIGWLDLPRTRRRDYLPRIARSGPVLRTAPRRRSVCNMRE